MKKTQNKKIKVVSLFDGVGCAYEALTKLGYDPKYWASENDKYALQVSRYQHPLITQMGDVCGVGDCENFTR